MTVLGGTPGECRCALVGGIRAHSRTALLRRGDDRGILDIDLISLRKAAGSNTGALHSASHIEWTT
jgi:hypothetical protein